MSKIGFKSGVRMSVACLKFFALTGAQILNTAPAMIDDTVIVTSCDDSTHGKTSFHYIGRALDLRCFGNRSGAINTAEAHSIPLRPSQITAAQLWVERLKQALGPAFDVVLESDHIHIEYQRGNPID